jgi:hypothetical protein
MINNYYYNNQLRTYIQQFASVFTGLRVKTGKGKDGAESYIQAPVRYGSIDRVVAAITQRNSQNLLLQIPMMSCNLMGLDLAPERRKGVGVVDRRTVFPTGGVYPDDMRVIERVMPIPYNMTMELAFYASNTDQAFQMLEQILQLFDPTLQIQTSDKPFDWTKLTYIELQSVQTEENYPIGGDKRMVVWSFNFMVPIWIAPPADMKKDFVKTVVMRFGDMEGFSLDEYDNDGELQPFREIWGQTEVTADTP